MLPATFIKGYDQRRLRALLTLLFVALAIPTTAVIWQAYDQLKWEAWYQYRNQAEELTGRVDLAISQRVTTAEARSFSDFSFLNVTAGANVVQRSPLSVVPVHEELPGVIGYFQIDPHGSFSTPLLPGDELNPADLGLDREDYGHRVLLAGSIRQILAENRLVTDRAISGGRIRQVNEVEEMVVTTSRTTPETDDEGSFEEAAELVRGLSLQSEPADADDFSYDQQGFDLLNSPQKLSAGQRTRGLADSPASLAPEPRDNSLGRIQDLRLDDNLQKKSEDLKRDQADLAIEKKEAEAPGESRARRVEQAAAAPSPAVRPGMSSDESTTITTFESEIDPYQFSLLDSGHLVLFRNVWRDGSRYIQGLLIDQAVFTKDLIETAFQATTLAEMSNLVIGYNDDVINLIRGGSYAARLASASELDGSLLYRRRLSAPFDRVELIYAVNQMPPGPGASVLGWTTIVIAIVFLGGFFALYRLGLSQIKLARQQQDFVSAVSHELKTPLTSIRMYGEMLKEGWADEKKQKQYYEYIHDESERLTRLISNVLQLARITRNEPQFDLAPVSVAELMGQVGAKISNQVERAGFELVLKQDESTERAIIKVDNDCFAQIIINLVDNAIKFSKDAVAKKIEIATTLSNDARVTFSVRDFGPGIPKSQLKKIFQLFYRTESELTRETVGTGIGLAIVHQLTTAMNGSVDVINLEPGVEFRVSFPT